MKRKTKMTKAQIRTAINRIRRSAFEKTVSEVNAVLKEADMWYGCVACAVDVVDPVDPENNRNGDRFIRAVCELEPQHCSNWLITRKQLSDSKKNR